MNEEKRNPWDRQDGESVLWYGRFWQYLKMGQGRSVYRVYAEEYRQKDREPKRLQPGIWTDRSVEHNWTGRAAAWDEFQLEEDKRFFKEAARKNKKQRIRILNIALAKLRKRLKSIDANTLAWKELTALLRAVNDQLRSEYGDKSKSGVEVEVSSSGGRDGSAGGSGSNSHPQKVVVKILSGDASIRDLLPDGD